MPLGRASNKQFVPELCQFEAPGSTADLLGGAAMPVLGRRNENAPPGPERRCHFALKVAARVRIPLGVLVAKPAVIGGFCMF